MLLLIIVIAVIVLFVTANYNNLSSDGQKAYDNLESKFSTIWTLIKCGFMLMMIIAMISSWF